MHDGSLRRVDPVTGQTMWTVPSDAAPITRCFPMDGSGGTDGARAASGTTSPAPVACVAESDPNGSEADPPRARVVVLDPSTGAVSRTVQVHGSLLAAEPLDGDLLVVARLADGRLSAARWGLEASAPRWEYASRGPVLADASGALTLRSESLTVDGLALDLATGEERTAEDVRLQPIGLEEHILPGGEHATWWRYATGRTGRAGSRATTGCG